MPQLMATTSTRRSTSDAKARGILVDDLSSRERSDFSTPHTHHVGLVTVIDTRGRSPSFARRLLAELRDCFDERYASGAWVLPHAREYAKVLLPPADRGAVMASLAGRDIHDLAALNPAAVEHEVDVVYAALRCSSSGTAETHGGVPLVAATRGSALALWQTRHVAGVLARAGIASTTLPLATTADRVQDRALAALGSDGVFVKELELALREARADYAVHSCKDLPGTLPDDMRLAAIGPRADPRDAFCSERYASFDALPPGAIVGTSSPRRRAQLQARRPDLVFATIRGNLETRLRKLREGQFDAILLALAGLERLGLRATYTVAFAPEVVVPAVGQGALALETRAADGELAQRLHAAFADPATEFAVAAERAFLRTCRGGCQAPVGAHATYADGTLSLRAVIAEPDGQHAVAGEVAERANGRDACERLGDELAQRLLAQGGEAILAAAVETRAPGPLAGRVFLLPRTQDRPSTIGPAFERAGARVVEAHDGAAATAAFAERPPDALLFPSAGSVKAILPYLASLHAGGVHPIVAGMGDASSAAAREAGFPADVVATEPTDAAFVQSVTRYLIEHDNRWTS